MKVSLLPACLVIASLYSLAPVSVLAAELDALPPPTHSGVPAADAGNSTSENQSHLNKELAPPSEKNRVQVYSYRRSDGALITKYSMHGRVYMIKVEPGHGMPAYYLYDTNGDGHFDRRMPGNYKMISPPMWVIKRF